MRTDSPKIPLKLQETSRKTQQTTVGKISRIELKFFHFGTILTKKVFILIRKDLRVAHCFKKFTFWRKKLNTNVTSVNSDHYSCSSLKIP